MSGSTPFARSATLVFAAVLLGGALWAAPAAAKKPEQAANGRACTVVGTSGNDRLVGSARTDVICGLGGNDTLIGDGGNDILDGGAGSDFLLGGTGGDTLLGGAGTDTASYTDHVVPVTADIDSVADDGGNGERDRITTDVENITGGNGNDKLTGNSAKNDLRGGGGNDVLTAGGGDDKLDGASGNDRLDGASGNDRLNGGDGDDTMTGGPGADNLDGGTGENTCTRDNDDISPENACSDTDAPVIDPASIAWVGPTTFDSDVANTVKLRMRVTDARSGVEAVSAQLETPSRGNGGLDKGGRLISGTRYDGVWEATVVIPRFAVPGEWHLLAIHTNDRLWHHSGIHRSGDGTFTTSTLVPLPVDLGPITITGEADSAAPVVDTSSLAWVGETDLDNAVDNTVRVRARITDAQSGVAAVYGWFGGELTKQWEGPSAWKDTPVSGSAHDGVWELSAVIPRYAPAGSWRLRQLCTYDDLMNQTCYFVNPDGTYRTFGGDTVTLSLPALTLSGEQSDSAPPVVDLKSFKWHGDHHFSNNADNVVTMRVDIADDLSGVREATCWLGPVGGSGMAGGSAHVVHGTERDGTWEFSITLPKFAPAGQYRISECMFIDRVGNRNGLSVNSDGSYSTLDQQTGGYSGPIVSLENLPLIEMTETSLNP